MDISRFSLFLWHYFPPHPTTAVDAVEHNRYRKYQQSYRLFQITKYLTLILFVFFYYFNMLSPYNITCWCPKLHLFGIWECQDSFQPLQKQQIGNICRYQFRLYGHLTNMVSSPRIICVPSLDEISSGIPELVITDIITYSYIHIIF